MSKTKKPTSQEIKNAGKRLKKAGLYSGDLRKPATRYLKRLTKEYASFLSGRAKVVKIPLEKTKTATGYRAASKTAQDLAERFSQIMSAKGNKVIVRGVKPQVKMQYDKASGGIVSSYKDEMARSIYRTPTNFKTVDDLGKAPKDASFSLPIGNTGEFITRTRDEMISLIMEYEGRSSHQYKDAVRYLQITTVGKYKGPKKQTRKPRRRKQSAKIIPFRKRGK